MKKKLVEDSVRDSIVRYFNGTVEHFVSGAYSGTAWTPIYGIWCDTNPPLSDVIRALDPIRA